MPKKARKRGPRGGGQEPIQISTEAKAADTKPSHVPGIPPPPTEPMRQPPPGLEKSQLHRRCLQWISEMSALQMNPDEMANRFCQYGGFLSNEKARLAERGTQQERKSKVIASVFGTAMRAKDQVKMEKLRKQSEDNERAFEVTKLEAEVLNYHLDLFRHQEIYAQLEQVGKTMAIQIGETEFVMRPEIDLPEISIESALEEEQELAEYMAKLRLEKQAAAATEAAAARASKREN